MRYTLLGRSGLRVSEVALGTMTFGEVWGWGASEDESQRMFETFVEAGGNFVDTACNYTDGQSESIVGALVEPARDRFVVATKYTLTARRDDPNAGGNHRKNLVQTLGLGLARCGSVGHHGSGEIFVAFASPGRRPRRGADCGRARPRPQRRVRGSRRRDRGGGAQPSLGRAEVAGREGRIGRALPHDDVLELLAHGRLDA